MKMIVDYVDSTNAKRTGDDQPLSAPNLVFRADGRGMIGQDCYGEQVICNIRAVKGSQNRVSFEDKTHLGPSAIENLDTLGDEPVAAFPVQVPGSNMTYIFTRAQVNGPSDVLGYTDAQLSLFDVKVAIDMHNSRLQGATQSNDHNQAARP